MTSTSSVIEVDDLRMRYPARHGGAVVDALDGITFQVREGETFALLGPNGAGKTTTVEILEGYRMSTGGVARVLGVDPSHGSLAWKAQLGIVLQSTGESGNVTVREQLRQFAGYYPHARDVGEVIDAVGLTEKAGARIRSLSGGQRRRVDVALGIIGRPRLLFLDEPTTGFDPEARRRFWELIRRLQREGTTILLTTHYLDEAAQLSDRVGVIQHGRLVDVGAVDEIGCADARVPIVRWREADGLHECRTNEPGGLTAELVTRLGQEPSGLEIVRPSLEDIYLRLVAGTREAAEDAEPSIIESEAGS
jgi:ABC-type multidrug transport system, ATPase component